jgi:hypothetical protein
LEEPEQTQQEQRAAAAIVAAVEFVAALAVGLAADVVAVEDAAAAGAVARGEEKRVQSYWHGRSFHPPMKPSWVAGTAEPLLQRKQQQQQKKKEQQELPAGLEQNSWSPSP